MSASGRVCEITNGRFVEAKHEKRWLAVRLLRSKPAGRFGSRPDGRCADLVAVNLSLSGGWCTAALWPCSPIRSRQDDVRGSPHAYGDLILPQRSPNKVSSALPFSRM
jgi:hypothetical protein